MYLLVPSCWLRSDSVAINNVKKRINYRAAANRVMTSQLTDEELPGVDLGGDSLDFVGRVVVLSPVRRVLVAAGQRVAQISWKRQSCVTAMSQLCHSFVTLIVLDGVTCASQHRFMPYLIKLKIKPIVSALTPSLSPWTLDKKRHTMNLVLTSHSSAGSVTVD